MATDFTLLANSLKAQHLISQIGFVPTIIRAIGSDDIKKKESPIMYSDRIAYEAAISCQEITLVAFKAVFVGRRLINIPKTKDDIYTILKLYTGRNHIIHTSVVLYKDGVISKRRTSTRVKIKNLSNSDMQSYIQSNQWVGKVGGYDFDGMFQRFIVKITGSTTGAEGLPCYEVFNLLQKI